MRFEAALANGGQIDVQAEEGAERCASKAKAVGDHQACIKGRVSQDGKTDGKSNIESLLGQVVKAGLGIEITHGDGEEEVAGNGENGP